MLAMDPVTHERLGRARFELTQPFLGKAIAAHPGELCRLHGAAR